MLSDNVPVKTAAAVNATRAHGGRVIAIGTTVVRALEAAGARNGILRAGNDVATGRIGVGKKLRIVDAIVTGTHQPGTSHHALLGAFLGEMSLRRLDAELATNHYRAHEFGDSLLIERGDGSISGWAEDAADTSCPVLRRGVMVGYNQGQSCPLRAGRIGSRRCENISAQDFSSP